MKLITILFAINCLFISKYTFNALNHKQLNYKFIAAAKCGDFTKVQQYLKQGAQIDSRNKLGQGYCALHEASFKGNLEIVKFLIENGAKIDLEDNLGRTALYFAIQNNRVQVTDLLIKSGANIHKFDFLTMLCKKIESNSKLNSEKQLAYKILAILFNTNRCDNYKIQDAIAYNADIRNFYYNLLKEQAIERLANRKITSQSALNNLLKDAVESYPNALNKYQPSTNLRLSHYMPCVTGSEPEKNFELIKFYIECGAQPSAHMINHSTPFEICKFIANRCSNIDDENFDGKTALYYAIRDLHVSRVNLLATCGANLNKTFEMYEDQCNDKFNGNYLILLLSFKHDYEQSEKISKILKILLNNGISHDLPLQRNSNICLNNINNSSNIKFRTEIENVYKEFIEIKNLIKKNINESLPNVPKELTQVIHQYLFN